MSPEISRRKFMQALTLATAAVAVGGAKATKRLVFEQETPGFRETFEEGDVIFIPVQFPREEGISWSPEGGGSLPTPRQAVTCEIQCRVFTAGKEPIFEYRGSRYNRNELFAEVSWRSLQGKPI